MAAPKEDSLREFTVKDVASHKSRQDVWIIIHGKVYNVTDYLSEHPGGDEILVEAGGTDASEPFDGAGHSEDAFKEMEEFCVGKLHSAAGAQKRQKLKPVAAAAYGPAPSSPWTSALVKVGLVSLAAGASYYVGRRQGLTAPPWLVAMRDRVPLQRRNDVVTGLVAGGAVIMTTQALLLKRLADMIFNEKHAFAPHAKMPRALPEDALLRRGELEPTNYTSLPLSQKTLVAPNTYRLTFALPTAQAMVGIPTGQHLHIKAQVNGDNVSRPYTPVSNNTDRGIVELVVKMYPDGKLTNGYLAKLEVGEEALVRGPTGPMRYHRRMCKKIGMVAAGTGITPMYQLIRAICEDDRDTTQISLLYASRTEQDIILRKELDAFARRYPKNFKVYYVLNEAPPKWAYGTGYINKKMMVDKLPKAKDDTKMMLCGPPPMVEASKALLVDLGFQKPGKAAKMTDQIFLF